MNASVKVMLFGTLLATAYSTAVFAEATASDVLNDLHAANQMEIHMGNLAQNKGSTPDARDFGKTLTRDHEESDKKVVDLASKEGVELKPTGPGLMDKVEMNQLKSLSGADFDRAFARHMIDDHKKDIAKLESAQKANLPEEVRHLVGDTLPTLHKHLEKAQKLYGQPS